MNNEDIRALIRAHPRSAEGYPQQVRDTVGSYAKQRREEGARWTDIEAEVGGVSSTTMANWIRRLSDGFHQVVIVDETPEVGGVPEALVITSPSGFTLTGCTLEQAAVVMQRLP